MIREVCCKLSNSASERRAFSDFLNYGQLIMKRYLVGYIAYSEHGKLQPQKSCRLCASAVDGSELLLRTTLPWDSGEGQMKLYLALPRNSTRLLQAVVASRSGLMMVRGNSVKFRRMVTVQ